MAVTRSTTASWVIPTVNEWYKSAYYVGGGTNASYWLYPTQNDNLPSNVLSATGTNNANYTAITNTPPFAVQTDPTDWLTPVGAFMDSPGPYGTFDQGGNVWQWLEDPLDGVYREARGGSFPTTGAVSLAQNLTAARLIRKKRSVFESPTSPSRETQLRLLAWPLLLSCF